ncbi:Protein of unknown function [Cotesia congregata]|uniref:Uncharacterized protein n=1 Tax=Cotesia congregata TaxID=51543 RepID=A0A8J2MSM8_COTCN|nr:Protein of unknown function [Cotesia congregata]
MYSKAKISQAAYVYCKTRLLPVRRNIYLFSDIIIIVVVKQKNYYLHPTEAVFVFTGVMIDWVSIVRHSRRRFSDYVNAVPMKIRKRRQKNPRDLLYVSSTDDKNSVGYYERLYGLCICCRKIRHATRNVDEQLPPPPSPPQIKEAVQLDGVSRPSSVERVIHSEISPHISANHDTHKVKSYEFTYIVSEPEQPWIKNIISAAYRVESNCLAIKICFYCYLFIEDSRDFKRDRQ